MKGISKRGFISYSYDSPMQVILISKTDNNTVSEVDTQGPRIKKTEIFNLRFPISL